MNETNKIKKKRFAANLNKLLEENLMSQAELADRMGLARSVINSWAQGNAIPKKESIYKIAQIFGVEPDELLYDPRDERTKEIIEKINILNNTDKEFVLKIIENLLGK